MGDSLTVEDLVERLAPKPPFASLIVDVLPLRLEGTISSYVYLLFPLLLPGLEGFSYGSNLISWVLFRFEGACSGFSYFTRPRLL